MFEFTAICSVLLNLVRLPRLKTHFPYYIQFLFTTDLLFLSTECCRFLDNKILVFCSHDTTNTPNKKLRILLDQQTIPCDSICGKYPQCSLFQAYQRNGEYVDFQILKKRFICYCITITASSKRKQNAQIIRLYLEFELVQKSIVL